MSETHWFHRPDARTCGHSTREAFAVPPVENRSEIEEVTHTLIPVGHTCFLGLHTDLFVRSRLPKVTPLRTWFFDAGVHRYRLSYTRLEYHPVISYRLSRCPELPYRKTVVRAFGSFPERPRAFQIPAMFPKIPYAVDYCGFSSCLSLEKRERKAAGEVQKRRRAH